ncbi:MAG: CHAD domain-containing protein [SAR324 cluster bacterium]|nr:CHAD domain-containing protein [SAR324 cluster bacterium]
MPITELEIDPLQNPSKFSLILNPRGIAVDEVRQVLLRLYEVILLNEPGVLKRLDIEFLHEYRVAIRKTRSAITQLKHIFPSKPYKKFRDEFAWLGAITSLPRDLDVYAMQFDNYVCLLPEEYRTDLFPLKIYIQKQQSDAYSQLWMDMRSRRYKKLKAEWLVFLEQEWGQSKNLPMTGQAPAGEVVTHRIHDLFQLAVNEGTLLQENSPADEWHELRKTLKKLRYLIEFFSSFYDESTVSQLVKILKTQQQLLGNFQDYQVQQQSLKGFAEDLMNSGKVKATTLCAIGMLLQNLYNQQQRLRQDFQTTFQPFAKFQISELRCLSTEIPMSST